MLLPQVTQMPVDHTCGCGCILEPRHILTTAGKHLQHAQLHKRAVLKLSALCRQDMVVQWHPPMNSFCYPWTSIQQETARTPVVRPSAVMDTVWQELWQNPDSIDQVANLCPILAGQ